MIANESSRAARADAARLVLVLALVLALAAALAGCNDAGSPKSAVVHFYASYLHDPIEGVPPAARQKEIAPVLSARLLRLIEAARAHSEAFARAHPGEKPPFVEGCLFASLFEGPRGFEIARIEPRPDGGADVVVRFWYERGKVEWEDTVVVAREGDRYVIDDVLFSGAGEFNPSGRLSDILAAREE